MGEYQDNSLGSRVFQRLREDILSGKYKEHDELRENTLGKELGVSRTPVREALRQLELEGLVTIIPNKGAYVTGISSKDIRDIYILRSICQPPSYNFICSSLHILSILAINSSSVKTVTRPSSYSLSTHSFNRLTSSEFLST